MLEQFQYINHLNEIIEFGKNGIYANYNELRNYQWNFEKTNNKISNFKKDIVSKKLPIIIQAASESEGIFLRNKLYEVFDKDVLNGRCGKLIIGGYYYKCYITGSKKSEYLLSKRHLKTDLTVSSDNPVWVKDETTHFNMVSASAGGLNFPFNYAFNFSNSMNAQALINNAFSASQFKMIIFGPCVNPSVVVSGQIYKVNCIVEDSEYLTIDSMAKEVYITQNNGMIVNKFNSRDKENYIFEPIPPGENSVSWGGDLKFDIILFDERGEPKWI